MDQDVKAKMYQIKKENFTKRTKKKSFYGPLHLRLAVCRKLYASNSDKDKTMYKGEKYF